MKKDEMNALEREVMKLFVAGTNPILDVLRSQLEVARVRRRELTGGGFITHFDLPADVPLVESPADLVLDDVGADIAGLETSAEFQLFVGKGRIESLECAVFGEDWPENASMERAFYLAQDPRGSGTLIKTQKRQLDELLAEWSTTDES